ncbi:MAG: OsmC family protein [Hyphomicrobiaceae bacterium]
MSKPNIKVKSALYRLRGTSPSHGRTDITTRDVALTTDEPKERGGTNTGMSPTETLFAALVGCTNNISTKIAHAMDLTFTINEIICEVEFDRRGVLLDERVEVPFPNAKLVIDVNTNATDEQLEAIRQKLPQYCPVSMVIRQAGTNLSEEWKVTRV